MKKSRAKFLEYFTPQTCPWSNLHFWMNDVRSSTEPSLFIYLINFDLTRRKCLLHRFSACCTRCVRCVRKQLRKFFDQNKIQTKECVLTSAFDIGMTILISIRCKKFLMLSVLLNPNIVCQHPSGFVVARNRHICKWPVSFSWSRTKK